MMANPELERTLEGFEIQIATNLLGHFLFSLYALLYVCCITANYLYSPPS